MSILIVIRGNSGSGKSTIAQLLRNRLEGKVAVIGQDYFQRMVLGETGVDQSDNVDLISQTIRFCFDRGFIVILEGILTRKRYSEMITGIIRECSESYLYYIDVSFKETLRRHLTKPNCKDFGEAEMRRWWIEHDLLHLPNEATILESFSVEDSVNYIIRTTGMAIKHVEDKPTE